MGERWTTKEWERKRVRLGGGRLGLGTCLIIEVATHPFLAGLCGRRPAATAAGDSEEGPGGRPSKDAYKSF